MFHSWVSEFILVSLGRYLSRTFICSRHRRRIGTFVGNVRKNEIIVWLPKVNERTFHLVDNIYAKV